MTAAFRAVVHGMVQGVGFRWGARAEADRLGLAGYVRNVPDGTVEVIAEGRRDALEAFVRWLGHGPELAGVDRVVVDWIEPPGAVPPFTVRR
ncbi:MAG: acylphosphatase [Deltaproteobacteria bacterium]|nr:acylphosphatase [Deltaproteobacteria bacterium]